MIIGLGLDVVELSRMKHTWERFGHRLARRILHPDEAAVMKAPEDRFLASRFAAKEAVVKALGTGFAGGVLPTDVAVCSLPSGKPEIRLYGRAAEVLEEMGATRIHLSLTHGRETVAAVVILERLSREESRDA